MQCLLSVRKVFKGTCEKSRVEKWRPQRLLPEILDEIFSIHFLFYALQFSWLWNWSSTSSSVYSSIRERIRKRANHSWHIFLLSLPVSLEYVLIYPVHFSPIIMSFVINEKVKAQSLSKRSTGEVCPQLLNYFSLHYKMTGYWK